MNGIGLDCGNSTVKLVVLSREGTLLWSKSSAHHGAAVQTTQMLLSELLQADSNAYGQQKGKQSFFQGNTSDNEKIQKGTNQYYTRFSSKDKPNFSIALLHLD